MSAFRFICDLYSFSCAARSWLNSYFLCSSTCSAFCLASAATTAVDPTLGSGAGFAPVRNSTLVAADFSTDVVSPALPTP